MTDEPEKIVVNGGIGRLQGNRAWPVQPIVYLTGTVTDEAFARRNYNSIGVEHVGELPVSSEERNFILPEVKETDFAQVEAEIARVALSATIIR